MFKILFYLLFIFISSLYSHVDVPTNNIKLSNYSIYEDSTSLKTINDIIKIKKWTFIKKDNFGYSGSSFWVKFSIEKEKENKKAYFLIYKDILIDYLDIYFVQNNKVVNSYFVGLNRSSKNKDIKNRREIFSLNFNKKNKLDIYVKLKNIHYPIKSHFKVLEKDSLDEYVFFDTLIISVYFIILFVMFIYHFIIYLITRYYFYKLYLLYLFLLINIGLYNTAIYHLYFLGNSASSYYTSIIQWAGFLMMFVLIQLFKHLINLKKISSFFNKTINYLFISFFLVYVSNKILSLVYNKFYTFFSIFPALIFILILLIMSFIIIKMAFKKSFISLILILVWIPLFLGIIIYTMNELYSFEIFNYIEYILRFLFVSETIFISLIIAFKLKKAEEKVNNLLLESKNKEIVYLRQNKLAAMGEMINNISHQWKQPLSRINAILFDLNIISIQNKLNKKNLFSKIELIENETYSMSKTISTFTDFFQPNKTFEHINLTSLVREKIKYINSLDEKIKINFLTSSANIFSMAYKNEYEQVLNIIVENAIDSINENNIKNPEIEFALHIVNKKVELSIANNGGLIKLKDINKIFEPYYTSKKNNNTGVGLYMAKILIEDSMKKELSVKNTDVGVKFCIKD